MSSFVIDKKEYVKAAGIIAGVSKSARDFWVYDKEAHRNSTPEDYYNRFIEIYSLNADSVARQYDDPKPESDPEEYKDIFNQYIQTGKQLYFNGFKNALLEIVSFFRSVQYQIECREYIEMITPYFYEILTALLQATFPGSRESWGSLEIAPEKCSFIDISELF